MNLQYLNHEVLDRLWCKVRPFFPFSNLNCRDFRSRLASAYVSEPLSHGIDVAPAVFSLPIPNI